MRQPLYKVDRKSKYNTGIFIVQVPDNPFDRFNGSRYLFVRQDSKENEVR